MQTELNKVYKFYTFKEEKLLKPGEEKQYASPCLQTYLSVGLSMSNEDAKNAAFKV